MVWYKNWTEYEAAATDLYASSPDVSKIRYIVKFRPKEGKLELKVTDDQKCLKFKSHSSIVLNRFETLNSRLLQLIAAPTALPQSDSNAGDTSMADVSAIVADEKTAAAGSGSGTGSKVTAQTTSTASGGGVGKKKKKGKK